MDAGTCSGVGSTGPAARAPPWAAHRWLTAFQARSSAATARGGSVVEDSLGQLIFDGDREEVID